MTYRFLVLSVLWLAVSPVVAAEVKVYTPGGLSEPMEAIAAVARSEGLAVTVVSGHSPAQTRQIEAGAPADIFISADPQWLDVLAAKGLVAEGTRTDLAVTRLVLFTVGDGPMTFRGTARDSLLAVASEGRLAIADPETLPAGRFTRAALERMGVWDTLSGHLAAMPHIRAVVSVVERGEAVAGIGYASDIGARGLRVVMPLPAEVAPPIVFPIVLLKEAADNPRARAVYAVIVGESGRRILRAAGFEAPP